MEELSSKVDQVLASVASLSNAPQELSARIGSRRVLAKLKDESVEEVELAAHQLLGIGDDPDKIVDLLRKRGQDVASAEIIGSAIPHKEMLGWCETLSLSFSKAWVSKQDIIQFISKLCYCGEGLMKYRQYDIAFLEIYDRFADRMITLRNSIDSKSISANIPKTGACLRFFLGRCMSLYQRSIQRDEAAKRPDTVECLRDVLKDIMVAVQFLEGQDETIREELYWAMYNSCLLAKRVSRWLRLHGFGSAALPALRWLSKAMNTCLPLMGMHFLPLRMRFYLELIYCAESAQHLHDAASDCAVALEQLAELTKLENMATPVPKETTEMLATMTQRFKMLKVKYDFWIGTVADVKVALGPDAASCVVPCLLEAFHIQHGLRWHFGSSPESATEMPEQNIEGGSEVTKFSYEQVHTKQRDLLSVIIAEVKPHLEKVAAITDLLDDFTKKRLAYEKDKEERASGHDTAAIADGEEGEGVVPPVEEPSKPDKEQLEGMGMNCTTNSHTIEDLFPLSAHIALARECLRQDFRGLDTKLQGEFDLLKKSLALRLRYRHFLRPPLVAVDVKETPIKDRDEVVIPDEFEFLTDDLNMLSIRNKKIEADEAAEKAEKAEAMKCKNPVIKQVHRDRPQRKHVFVIGQRYDAWKCWSPDSVVPIKRICNVRIVFSNQPPAGMQTERSSGKGGQRKGNRGQDKAAGAVRGGKPGAPRKPENATGTSANSFGFFDPTPTIGVTQPTTPWIDAYHAAGSSDNSGFDHVFESQQLRESMLQDLRSAGHVSQRCLAIPIEPHPGCQDSETTPFLTYGVYEERSLWLKDEKVQQSLNKANENAILREELEGEAQAEPIKEEVTDDLHLLPLSSSWLDKAELSTDPMQDLSVISTKYLHVEAKLPGKRFNAMIRTDLRQTPGELLGLPLQNYYYLCAALDSPSPVFIAQQLRLMHAFQKLHLAMASLGEEVEADDEGQYKRPEVISKLLEMSDCLDSLLEGATGRLFLLDAADILEEVCSFVFLKLAWPKLQFIQERLEKHELDERILTENEKMLLSEWCMVLRRIMPILLSTLENVHAVDGLTLASAAYGLAKLFMQENDSRSAYVQLGMAIVRLENELWRAANLGPQPQYDRPSAASVSFDPPSLRLPQFALYEDDAFDDCSDDADKFLLLERLSRLDQDRFTLLTLLYEQWIDCSLKTHFKNVSSTVRRVRKPGEYVDDDLNGIVIDTGSTKITLSNPEADLIARLGQNPYLRSLFFVAVARRRPDVATTALGKACSELESATSQEQQLWAFSEKELIRQQKIKRTPNSMFCEEFTRRSRQKEPNLNRTAGEKPKAHPPMVFGRSARCIRLRTPPLLQGTHPPQHPAACELAPEALVYKESQHSQQLGKRENTKIVLTCCLLGKEFGAGAPVAEVHKSLPGTAIRFAGHEFLEISGLKPNTNYSFASIYYEGFEATRSVGSTVSESTPPIGTYHPLPLSLLRIVICKAIIRHGLLSNPVWARTWGSLFEHMCERTTLAEEFDSCGLRTFKLRLDVADRMPPAILAAFAETIILKNNENAIGSSDKFPSTRPLQQPVLRSANECLVAVDCASRAGNGPLTIQAVSVTLRIVTQLLQYRTKPQLLLTCLTRCAACLEVLQLPQHHLAWHSRARSMVTYLFHHISVLCVQLGRPATLAKQLDGDDAQRFAADSLVDSKQHGLACARVLDEALELALLGDLGWPRGEAKAKAALEGQANADELLRCLKEFSARNYVGAAKESALLALNDDAAKHPNALSFLQCAINRAWQGGGMDEILADTLAKHPLSSVLSQVLESGRENFVDHGFMLRAAPPVRVVLPPSEPGTAPGSARDTEDGGVPQDATEDRRASKEEGEQEDAVPVGPTLEELRAELAEHSDAAPLAQLELLKTAPILSQLSNLKFHWHDISRFKYLDLSQISVPKLTADDATLGKSLDMTETDEIEAPADGGDENVSEWDTKENENKERRKSAFELFEKLMPPLVRASTYADLKQADLLLQTIITSVLNALYIVGPTPVECVPPGPKSNPEDSDPDAFVGAPKEEPPAEGEEPPAEDPQTPEVENDMWLNLALLADTTVNTLTRLKKELTSPQNLSGATLSTTSATRRGSKRAATKEGLEDVELEVIRSSKAISKATEGADEEVVDYWFQRRPDLDIASFAKVVAFAALCLYHMRRWSSVVRLCWNFNDATCGCFASSFLPLAISAQAELCTLSKKAIQNTKRYISTSRGGKLESDEPEDPEKQIRLLEHRKTIYEGILKRQKNLDEAWSLLLRSIESAHSLVTRAVPAALEMLRNSRILLANFLEEKQDFNLQINRGALSEDARVGRERALRLAATGLVSSYRKSGELLRKRQMTDQVVQALHELGNIQWLEGDAAGAQSSWSDAVDVAFQFVYAIKNWRQCLESNVKPPQDTVRVERMMLSVAILSKHARFTASGNSTGHLNAALFASGILETILTSALPHPSHRMLFCPNKYRMRELFFGMRESHMLLPPNSLGLDGLTFLGSLAFLYNALTITGYQVARCIPICAIYNYVATDICRNVVLAVKGRLMMARALLNCRDLSSTWLILFSIAHNQDLPRALLAGELLDKSILQVQETLGAEPFRNHEEPFTEANVQATTKLLDFAIAPMNQGDPAETLGLYNVSLFQFLQVNFLVTICSYGRVFTKLSDPEEKERLGWLDKADQRLSQLWVKLTGRDDDIVAWSTSLNSSKEKGSEPTAMVEPSRELSEEEAQLCVDIRFLRARLSETRGDLARAVLEILHGMHFLQLLAQKSGRSRGHPDMKSWMALRRRMVQLLIAQGRHSAAEAHIEKGLHECSEVNDDLSRVDLLAAKARIEVFNGRLLETHGAPPNESQTGALVSLDRCLSIASKSLPIPTPSAISARMMLVVVLGQDSNLSQIFMDGGVHFAPIDAPSNALPSNKKKKGEEQDDLEAQQRVLVSPIAKALQSKNKAPSTLEQFRTRQVFFIRLVIQCLEDIDKLLAVQGFVLHSPDRNALFNIGASDDVPEYPQLPFLPPLRRPLRERHASDTREPPHIYFELLPTRCCYELMLIKLCLELGDFSEARRLLPPTKEDVDQLDHFEVGRLLLKEAESRATRCLHFMPWLHVQLSLLKLQWRRLDLQIGVASKTKVPPRTNFVIYRDPKTFAEGVSPPTTSAVFRTFVQRARAPSLMQDTEWVLAGQVDAEGSMEKFVHELLVIIRISTNEGGHDYSQLRELINEGIQEVLRCCRIRPPESTSMDLLYAFFACVASVTDVRKALQFDPVEAPPPKVEETAKGGKPAAAAAAPAPPPNVDATLLPLRVSLDLQAHLKRQSHEGALAYSAAAQLDAKKSLLFNTVVKHSFALRRECNTFGNIFQESRLVCDQLHVALSQASEHYKKAKILDEGLLSAIETPTPVPSSGDMLIQWVSPSPPLGCPPRDACILYAFICPFGEDAATATPFVAQTKVLQRSALRSLFSRLRDDLDHCKPAVSVTGEFMQTKLRTLVRSLRGVATTSTLDAVPEDLEEDLEKALLQLLITLQDDAAAQPPVGDDGEELPPVCPELVSAAKVQKLLRAMVTLLDAPNHSARIAYPEFTCFLRKLLAPFSVF